VVLSDDEMVRLSDEWLSDDAISLHFSALCDELASAIPVIAESIEDISKMAYDMSRIFPNTKNRKEDEIVLLGTSRTPCRPLGNEEQNPSTITQVQIDPFPAYSQGRREFKCIKCRRVYDRATRARDCANQDLGLTPYQCKGACGDVNWSVPVFRLLQKYLLTCDDSPVAYSSEECWRRHLAPSVQCPRWYVRVQGISNDVYMQPENNFQAKFRET
jgi:hypothetical protein